MERKPLDDADLAQWTVRRPAIRLARRVMAEPAKLPLPAPAGSGTADAPITEVIKSGEDTSGLPCGMS